METHCMSLAREHCRAAGGSIESVRNLAPHSRPS